jgi:quercetin dioxygenase-like cupin family protein
MKVYKKDDMDRGWFVGDFYPTCLKTIQCEVAVKEYPPGAYEVPHYHKVATEVTLIIEGEVEMNGVRYSKGDVLVIEPNEATDFRTLTKVVNVVVKVPGQKDDKYLKDV